MHAVMFDVGAGEAADTSDLALDSLQSLLQAVGGFVSVLVLEAGSGYRVTATFHSESAAATACDVFAAEPEWARAHVTVSAPARVHGQVEHVAGQVRHIRAAVPADRIDEVSQFWRTRGRAVIESAPGCLRARGFIDREGSELVLVIWWRSNDDAETFRLSDFHEAEFVVPLGEDVIRLGRAHLEPIDE